MAIISLIAAIDEQRGLGKDNALLCYLPADLSHFKQLTLGKPVIMGRKTHESIGKPLPGRPNIVLSKHASALPGVTVASSLSQALALTSEAPEVMIIGGAKVFEEALPIADRIYLTVIHHQFDADVFFPKLNETTWHRKQAICRAKDEKNKYDMTFILYVHSR